MATKKPSPDAVKCGQCDGEGYTDEREGDRNEREIRAACYHCSTTGWIDPEMAFADRVSTVATILASRIIDRYRESTDREAQEEQTGEGWAFCAAENMMTSYDYTTARVWEKEAEVVLAFEKLDKGILRALVDEICPEKPSEPETPKDIGPQPGEWNKIEPYAPPVAGGPLPEISSDDLPPVNDDELPF